MKRDWLVRGYPRRVRDCGWEGAVKNALMSDSDKKSRKKKNVEKTASLVRGRTDQSADRRGGGARDYNWFLRAGIHAVNQNERLNDFTWVVNFDTAANSVRAVHKRRQILFPVVKQFNHVKDLREIFGVSQKTCVRLYISVFCSSSHSFRPSVRPSICHTLLFCGFRGLWPHCSCPNDHKTSNIAPAHPHATRVAVYPALFLVADTRLYTSPCSSVGYISKFRAVFALRLLPNPPQLSCRVAGLVFLDLFLCFGSSHERKNEHEKLLFIHGRY